MLCINTPKKKTLQNVLTLTKIGVEELIFMIYITQSNAATIIAFMRHIHILQFSNIKIGAYVGSSEEGGLHFDEKSHVFCMKQIV